MPPILRPHPPHIYNEWPRVFYGPNGASELFTNMDEVPEGWVTHPKMLEPDYEELEKADADDEEPEETVSADNLAGAYSQDTLIDFIDAANKGRGEDDQIEYLGNWSKVRLAQALLDAKIIVNLPEKE